MNVGRDSTVSYISECMTAFKIVSRVRVICHKIELANPVLAVLQL